MFSYLSEPWSWSVSCLLREPEWSKMGVTKFFPCVPGSCFGVTKTCVCCWLSLCGVLSTTGTIGSCTADVLAALAAPLPVDNGIARIWPAVIARGPGALATRPRDCNIWGVAANTVPWVVTLLTVCLNTWLDTDLHSTGELLALYLGQLILEHPCWQLHEQLWSSEVGL